MTSITFKDNISFMYITMESLRQEIRDEMKSLRINKTHVYDILLRLIDEIDGDKPVSTPVVKTEPVTPTPTPTPEPVTPAPEPEPETPKVVKKVIRRVKKKVEA